MKSKMELIPKTITLEEPSQPRGTTGALLKFATSILQGNAYFPQM